jgi:putative oxidoreductase
MTGGSDRDRQSGSDAVLLIARLCLATVFLFSGITKAMDWQGTLAEFGGIGIPASALAAAATVAVQVLAGLAVAIGWRTRSAALALAGFTVVATLIGHPFWAFEGIDFARQLTTVLEISPSLAGSFCSPLLGPDASPSRQGSGRHDLLLRTVEKRDHALLPAGSVSVRFDQCPCRRGMPRRAGQAAL